MPREVALTCAAIAAAAALAGCGGSGGRAKTAHTPTTARAVDTQEVERLLIATQKRASPDFDVRDASCPARVVVTEGATFQCTVVVEGVVAPYTITLKDVNGDRKTGGYDLRPAKAILSVPKIVDFVKSSATDPNARVDCGPQRVKVLDPGSTFDCRLTDATGDHTVTLRVDDVTGKVTLLGAT
jgi:hypothetical protein